MLLSLTSLLFATISLSASVQASSLVAAPALLARQSSSLLPLGQNCTADADCQSDKCWPVSWYYGQTVCSPSPAGVACTDGSTCISESCTDGVCDEGTTSEGPKCYSGSDCYSDNCIAPFLGGGQYTQCFPSHVGSFCNDLSGCISKNCTDSVCQPGTIGSACFFGDEDGCGAGNSCSVIGSSDPEGLCYKTCC